MLKVDLKIVHTQNNLSIVVLAHVMHKFNIGANLCRCSSTSCTVHKQFMLENCIGAFFWQVDNARARCIMWPGG